MRKRLIAVCAMLCALSVMIHGAAAEEKRLGDFVYVPAMQMTAAGTIALRVEGEMLTDESDRPVVQHTLPGAEFGVYVISGAGELTPWANPLYPSEQMRIRTGEGETRFTLPQGAEYYLIQESAPQGYLFDPTAVIPVSGNEIVVRNSAAGELLVSAVDTMGVPLAGVMLSVTDEEGRTEQLMTDENGEAVFACEQAQAYEIVQTALPEGAFAALRVTGAQMNENGAAVASVKMANRTRVTFEHPASGSVLLDMKFSELDDNAQTVLRPLAGVRMEIESDPPVSIVTDEQGQARASLLEGTYFVRLAYEGEEDVILPLEEGQMIVSSGATTVIELSAVCSTGRIVMTAENAGMQEGGSVSFVSEQTGERFGPYAFDAEGMAVSQPLSAGSYRIGELLPPEGTQLGSVSYEGVQAENAQQLVLEVRSGEAAYVQAELLSRQMQRFALLMQSLDDQGEKQQTAIDQKLELSLIDEEGQTVAEISSEDGVAVVEALSGRYMLSMKEKVAEKLGVQNVSGVFALPSDEEAVVFAADRARMAVSSVDEHGAPVAGTVYRITDSEGKRYEIVCDADGMAVTPLLAPGEATIETMEAPAKHSAAQDQVVVAVAGELAHAEMTHNSHGAANMTVRVQSLDEHGNAVYAPLSGVNVEICRVDAKGKAAASAALVTTDESGAVSCQLEAGEYVAVIDDKEIDDALRAPQDVRFSVADTVATDVQLTAYDALGGVRVRLSGGTLTDEQMIQVRFELAGADGSVVEMTLADGVFYAGKLTEGTYTLRQTQMPEGYTMAKEREITTLGGEVLEISVPLEEYAMLYVSKTGLTFDDRMNTYIVPLSGEYGVYTMTDGLLMPYPSEEEQVRVWANVTPHEITMGKAGSAKLPADVNGTTYYLCEIGGVSGFEADKNQYEVTLRAGETATLHCAVSSDRGFFRMQSLDAKTGEHVPGGSYELLDSESGETVLAFEMGEEPYQNPMAVPVGSYVLRQKKAAPGYALSVPGMKNVNVEPYLTEGGAVTGVEMTAARIPQNEEIDIEFDLYAANQQGLTLLTVDAGTLGLGEALIAPKITISVGAAGSERSDIASLVIAGVTDAQNGRYLARVEYCLDGGGWQPSDARMTGVLEGPTAVTLTDVPDDIRAVRVSFIDAETGEEAAGEGFVPGQVTLNVEASAQGDVNMVADAMFEGIFAYRTEADGRMQTMKRSVNRELSFTMQASGLFETVSAGQDGRVSGVAFFDADADGLMDSDETSRYAGMTVSLLTASGDVANTVRTGADGSYAFDSISSGAYTVQFDAGDQVVFSSGKLYSDHVISGVEDTRFGMSRTLYVDGDHTDFVVNVGCMFAAEVSGVVLESTADGSQAGFGGLSVEMRPLDGGNDDEPLVVVTESTGEFRFGRILPGKYEISVEVPEGYLSREAEDGRIVKQMELSAGDSVIFGTPILEKSGALYGFVRVDDDGDGVIEESAQALEGISVVLMSVKDGYTQEAGRTVTDASGMYAFEDLYPGVYSVLFELGGEWAFTRYGGDSQVYGAVSQSGSTRSMELAPGETIQGVNAGVTIPAKLTVSVFKDTQYDGQKGVYEEMLSGVSLSLIRLENGADAHEMTATTDETGSVTFEGLSPGAYALAYQMPGQWRATKQVDPQTTSYAVSAVPQSTESFGRSDPFVLVMGQTSGRMMIGAMLSGTITGHVYYDDNNNARADEGEMPCAGIKVELISGDRVVAEAVSGEDGAYAFEGLAPGRYTIRFTAAEGSGFSGTERTASRGGVLASDTNISSTRALSVSGGAKAVTSDAGVVRLGTISGKLWEDQDGDKLPSAQERAMEGLQVCLMDGAGRNILRKTVTDGQGGFVFENLKPGTYKLRMDAPKGYVFSGAMEGGMLPLENERDGRGYSSSFTLLGGVHVSDIGFGLLTQGVISGNIWEDSDYDGLMADGESGLRGATIALLNQSGEQIASRQTVRSGEFSFDQLMPGDYSLRVTLPEGYAFTADGGESIAAHTTLGETDVFVGSLAMGGTISDVRIGALRSASVSGVVWYDENDDGRREDKDEGMPGVKAVLEMTGGRDAGKTLETMTDENGVYRFDGVMPGNARVRFELMDGYAFAKAVSGTRRVSTVAKTDALVAHTKEFAVAAGNAFGDYDAGVVSVGTITGRIWEDMAYDGKMDTSEPGVSNVLVELVDAMSGQTAASATTDESGSYAIGFARKGEYVLRVTLGDGMIFTSVGDGMIAGLDTNAGQTEPFSLMMGEGAEGLSAGAIRPAVISGRMVVDLNEDGVGADDEPGLAGGVVTVMQGGTAILSQMTAQDGSFSFDALRPGTYRLRYALADGTLFARGVNLSLTDEDAQEGETGSYTLAMQQHEQMDSVPVIKCASIGGYAFIDMNVNGVMDEGEAALKGVSVDLLNAAGQVISKHGTSEDGSYGFSGLRSGQYALRITLPEDMLFTDYTGQAGASCVPVIPGNVGMTQTIALAMGEGKPDMHIGAILPGKIGETVWLDSNGNGLQDYKEPLLSGVELTLYKVTADGKQEEAAHVVSDEFGYYWFDSLRPGVYVLHAKMEAGRTLTFSFGEPLEEIDSNLDPDTGMSEKISLQSGQTIRNVDVGFTEYIKN